LNDVVAVVAAGSPLTQGWWCGWRCRGSRATSIDRNDDRHVFVACPSPAKVVPRGADYERSYCIACEAQEHETCPWCFRSKLTKHHRMPIEKIAALMLQMEPSLPPRQLVHNVARYARSDKYAESVHLSLKVGSKPWSESRWRGGAYLHKSRERILPLTPV